MGEAVKLVELPFSEHGLTIAVMDPDGNVQIRTEEPIPDFCEEPAKYDPAKDPEFWKRRAKGESGHEEHFPL